MKKTLFFCLVFSLLSLNAKAFNMVTLGKFYNGLSDTCSVFMFIEDDYSYSIMITTGDKMALLAGETRGKILDASIRLWKPKEIKKFKLTLTSVKEKFIEWQNIYNNSGTTETMSKVMPIKFKSLAVQWRVYSYGKDDSFGGYYEFPVEFTGHSGESGYVEISKSVANYDRFDRLRYCYISLSFYSPEAIDHMLEILSDENINKYINLEKYKNNKNSSVLNQLQ